MSHVIVAAAMWAMLVACLFRLRARGRSAIPALTAASIAVSQTINIDWINLHLDDLLGDVGLSNMTMMTFFVVGIFLLGENLKAATGGRAFQPPAWVVLSVVLAVQTVSFFAINGRASTVHFTSTYGDQVATLIYSQSHFLYFGATLATVGVAVLRSGVLALPGAQRVGFGILLGASGVASIESLVIITRDLAGVIHAPSVYDAAEEIYKLLLPVVALAIATGLSIPPVVAAIKSRRHPSAMNGYSRSSMPCGQTSQHPSPTTSDLRGSAVPNCTDW